MSATQTTSTEGRVKQVIGAVVDVEFPKGELPAVYTALTLTNPSIDDQKDNLVLEVAQHTGDNTVRTISMDSTDGLVRGMAVKNTGSPISIPVGKGTLGRIMNVVGHPVDDAGPIAATQNLPIHRSPPSYEDQDTTIQAFETGIKVVDLLAPYARGGKIGLFGGAGVGKTVLIMELLTTSLNNTVDTLYSVVLANVHVKVTIFGKK
jgi:F-type H+-transporting ATPase subunit beta